MGTRCLTVFMDEGKEICVMYRQYDGYVEGGHGDELVAFLKSKKIINGYDNEKSTDFNGMGCLTAQVIARFKYGIGGIYVLPAGTRDSWEEYIYIVENNDGFPKVTVIEVNSNEKRILLDAPERTSSGSFSLKEGSLSFPKWSNRTENEIEIIQDFLKTGDDFWVAFIKKNGSDRKMYCTRGKIFTENLKGKSKKLPKYLLPVWDLKENGYRMVNLKTTYEIKW